MKRSHGEARRGAECRVSKHAAGILGEFTKDLSHPEFRNRVCTASAKAAARVFDLDPVPLIAINARLPSCNRPKTTALATIAGELLRPILGDPALESVDELVKSISSSSLVDKLVSPDERVDRFQLEKKVHSERFFDNALLRFNKESIETLRTIALEEKMEPTPRFATDNAPDNDATKKPSYAHVESIQVNSKSSSDERVPEVTVIDTA